jgi:SagB-type dehydrogenase family enzyme
LRVPSHSRRHGTPPVVVHARLAAGVRLEAHSHGAIFALFDDNTSGLGTFGAALAGRLPELQTGLPLGLLGSAPLSAGKELDLLVRRLASQRLLEFAISRKDGTDALAVVEPQTSDYWPEAANPGDADKVVLSRFAYMRRRGEHLVLESPLSGALFKIGDPKLTGLLATLSAPRQVKELRQTEDFPGAEFLGLLLESQILIKTGAAAESNLRLQEGGPDLALWDFHDLLFYTRSTEGRHSNPAGGTYPHGGAIPPLPDLRPAWPGEKIGLRSFLGEEAGSLPPGAKLLRQRHSTRNFDDDKPITLAELSQFLDRTARALPRPDGKAHPGGETFRPYPTAGASSELELYLAVSRCEGLAQGFYYYDPGSHALVAIEVPAAEVKALLGAGAGAMGVTAAPQVLITITARFGRVSWKYSSIAYSLILKDAGVLTQTLYLMAEEMGLGGCAIGLANIERFAKMTGIEYYIEGPVGLFALGRRAPSSDSHR